MHTFTAHSFQRPVRLGLLCLSLLLSACGTRVAMIEPGYVAVRHNLLVKPDRKWNHIDESMIKTLKSQGTLSDIYEVWTTEGLPLDQLRFYVGISAGQALENLALDAKETERKSLSVRPGMTLEQIAELVEAVYAHRDGRFKLLKLAPTTFAGLPGVRMEYSYLERKHELELMGLAYGAMDSNNRLYLMTFDAPKLHYYRKLAPSVDRIAQSARLVPR